MKAKVEVNISKKLGQLNTDIYGQYFEHVEDCIYPAVYDSANSASNDHGFRQDVIDATKELNVPIVRWPGGCFADVYHWEDGIGPKSDRPVRRNWHWNEIESNQFGTDEFLEWCQQTDVKPYINFNLGTGTLDEALRWMDYCNGIEETDDVVRRKKYGSQEPYDVMYWGIGNETWGSWEAGQMDAQTYAQTLKNWADFIKRNYPEVKLLGVGSFAGDDPSWDREVIQKAGRFLDYLTFHNYGYSLDRKSGEEYYGVVFTPDYIKLGLNQMINVVEETKSKYNIDKDIFISIDEWNIRHYEELEEGQYELNRQSPRNLQDAIFAAGYLNTMIQLHPNVAMGNYVFLVNGNGVMNVKGDQLVRTPLYYVFKQYSEWVQGEVLSVSTSSPTMVAPLPHMHGPHHEPQMDQEEVAYIDAVSVLHPDESIILAIINRSQNKSIEVQLDLPQGYYPREVWTLVHDDLYAVNDFEHPDKIKPTLKNIDEKLDTYLCPAHSIVLLKCEAN